MRTPRLTRLSVIPSYSSSPPAPPSLLTHARSSLPHPHKVIIAGNHDFALDNSTGFYDRRGVKIHAKYGYPRSDTTAALRYVRGKEEHGRGTLHYLENEGVEIEVKGRTWKCWGSPATPVFGHW